MRIAELHTFQKDLVLTHGPYTFAGTSLDAVDTTVIKIVSDTGLVGWGETCPLGPTYQPQHATGARAAIAQLAPGLIGGNALTPLNLKRSMDAGLNGHNYAKAAIDIAIMDLIGKHYGTRVCDLLGGATGDKVPSYAALAIGEPDEVARNASKKAKQGFPRLQIKVGTNSISTDIETVRKVWESVGSSVRIAVDANRSLTARDAMFLSHQCRDVPFVLEQPCNTIEEIAAIREQLNHPVYLDENIEDLNVLLRVISMGLCDGFGLKLTRLGGLNVMRTVRDICATRSMPHTCDDSFGGDIIAAACVHIGATVKPSLMEGVWISGPYFDDHYDPENGIKIIKGYIQVPDGPGLGINPDESLFGTPVASFS